MWRTNLNVQTLYLNTVYHQLHDLDTRRWRNTIWNNSLNYLQPFLKKDWGKPSRFFVYFCLFLRTMTNIRSAKFDYNWKKRRWCSWDSNPGPQNGRRRHITLATAAPYTIYNFCSTSKPRHISTFWWQLGTSLATSVYDFLLKGLVLYNLPTYLPSFQFVLIFV